MNRVNFRRFFSVALTMLLLVSMLAPVGSALIGTVTNPIVNTFSPEEIAVSDLIIKKTVEHPFGAMYTIPNNIAFDFEIDFGTFYAGFDFNTSAGVIEADAEGKIQVSVRPNVDFGIEGVDKGTVVTVRELQKEGDGFTPKDGIDVQQVTIQEDTAVVAEFVNVYNPDYADSSALTLSLKKVLQGRKWGKQDRFIFNLEYNKGNGWEYLGVRHIGYDENGGYDEVDITPFIRNLKFGKAGSYHIRITEASGKLENLTYDDTVNEIEIIVHDPDMDGKLQIVNVKGKNNVEVTVNEEENTYHGAITFTNVYLTPSPVIPADIIVPVNIVKKVKNYGDGKMTPEGFEFLLESVDVGGKMSVVTDKNGKAQIKLGFTPADAGKTYRFKLTEVNGKKTGVTYDRTVYNLAVSVEKRGGKLVANLMCNNKNVDEFSVEFLNRYRPDKGTSPDTGDHSHPEWYVIMAVISAALVALLLIFRKKIQDILN